MYGKHHYFSKGQKVRFNYINTTEPYSLALGIDKNKVMQSAEATSVNLLPSLEIGRVVFENTPEFRIMIQWIFACFIFSWDLKK